MLTAGSVKAQNLWLEVLAGRRHPLLHGYYCTRQPNDKERGEGISGTDARLAEANFFQTNEPWSTSALHARFGTPNLVQSISKLLTRIIQTSCVSAGLVITSRTLLTLNLNRITDFRGSAVMLLCCCQVARSSYKHSLHPRRPIRGPLSLVLSQDFAVR